ncbi:MAG: hypothetical protein R6X02_04655 [Enhygromyxa sp.]
MRLEELPFEARDPLALLGIVRGRAEPDLEFAGYGYATLPELELVAADGHRTPLREVLVLAVHTPDEPDEAATELELEFEVEFEGELISVLTPLRRFLEVRAAALVADATDVVLATCNPRDLRPAPPSWLTSGRRLHFASGDVIAWLDLEADGRETISLHAQRWHILPAPLQSTTTC